VKLTRSQEWFKRGLAVIPLATQTLSKATSQFVQGIAPIYVERGDGPYLWDVDGNRWTDYIAALGPVVLGYNNTEVNDAIIQQLRKGMSFSLSHRCEVELAERICSLIPGIEKVRFGKNGSDATAAAIRAARAFTGRDHVAICGYHGWQDWYIATTARSAGVPQSVKDLSHTFAYNDAAALETLFAQYPGKIAGVIVESIGFTLPEDNFLGRCKELAHKNGSVLIFDEIVNGFRLAPGGGGQHFGVTADLMTFGKAMANGAPISVVGGRREVMKVFDDIFFSTTFGGDTLGIAAALATLSLMEQHDGYRYLWHQGQRLQDGLQKLISQHGLEQHIKCRGLPHHTVVDFSGADQAETLLKKSLFQQECLKRGVLFLGIHFTSLSHTDAVIDETLRAYDESLCVFADVAAAGSYQSRLVGDPVKPVFRSRV
jgi:glutamate-1-semialdehyde aminotransferase